MDKRISILIETVKIDAKRAIHLGNIVAASGKVGILVGIFAAQPEASQSLIDMCYRSLNNAATMAEITRTFHIVSQELNKLSLKITTTF